MQRIAFLLFIGIVTVSSAAVKLNKGAKPYVNAMNEFVTFPRTCKVFKVMAQNDADTNTLIKSLSQISMPAMTCFENKGSALQAQAANGQISGDEIPAKLMQQCSQYAHEIVKLQQTVAELSNKRAVVVQQLYSELPQSVKDTLKMIQELKPNQGETPTAEEAAKIKAITASIRKYSEDDLKKIAELFPGTAEYVLPTGSQHAKFLEELDLIDRQADGQMTEEEKKALADLAMKRNEYFREHSIDDLKSFSERLDAYAITPEIDSDAEIQKVCNTFGAKLVNKFKKYIQTPAFKKKMNQGIKKSNQMHKAAVASGITA